MSKLRDNNLHEARERALVIDCKFRIESELSFDLCPTIRLEQQHVWLSASEALKPVGPAKSEAA